MPQQEQKESTVLDEKLAGVEVPNYSDGEVEYRSALLREFNIDLSNREQEHVEFDGMTYTEYWDENEKKGNTFIEPKKNKEDTPYQTGTSRNKLMALLAGLNNLNLTGDISGFDQSNLKISRVGDAMENIVHKTREEENDKEKKMLRQYELLKQGDVFVEEIQDERWMKKRTNTSGGKFTGQVKDMKWTSTLKKLFSRPSTNVLCGLNVVLGDMKQYDSSMQPHIWTIDIRPYEEAKTIFGDWERWKNVPKDASAAKQLASKDTTGRGAIRDTRWNILNVQKGYVVILRRQDPWNNEYALLINDVLMTPLGLPLTEINGFQGYNIVQQHLEPIHPKFAYGNSLMRRMKTQVGLLDEMIRMGILKTQRSFAPPLLNLTGRILSRRIFAPGKITQGIPKGTVTPLLEDIEGITTSELAMIGLIKDDINKSSVDPQFQGQKGKGDQTATEVLEIQRQARLVLGLTIFAAAMLEWKLTWLRLFNILSKWFEPQGEIVNEARAIIGKKFRTSNRPRMIEGEGMGNEIVVPSERTVSSEEVKKLEDEAKRISGSPTRLLFIDPKIAKSAKLTWQIVVKPKEETTSEMNRLLFRGMASEAIALFGQDVNLEHLEERFSQIWGEDPAKLFRKSQTRARELQGLQQKTKTVAEGIQPPTPEQSVGRSLKNSLKE